MAKLSHYLPTKVKGIEGSLQFRTEDKQAGSEYLVWDTTSFSLGIGTSSPSERLEVVGGINLGYSPNENSGTIRFTGTDFQGFDGTNWITFGEAVDQTDPGGLNGYVQFNDNGTFGGDSNFFWDDTNKRLGLGTTTPETQLELISTSWSTQHGLSVLQYSNSANQSGNLYLKHARGTPSSPSPTQNNDLLGAVEFGGYSAFASGCVTGAAIKARATQSWDTTSTYGTELVFYTVTNGATVQTERMVIGNDGMVSLSLGTGINEFSTDNTLGGLFPSDDAVPTEKAVKQYIDNEISSIDISGDSTCYWEASGTDIYYNEGNVGIGTSAPNERLDLSDSTGFGAFVVGEHEASSPVAGTIEWDGFHFRGFTGTEWVNLDETGGGGINEMDGGFANSVYLDDQEFDGGFANSTYLSSQSLDGGNA